MIIEKDNYFIVGNKLDVELRLFKALKEDFKEVEFKENIDFDNFKELFYDGIMICNVVAKYDEGVVIRFRSYIEQMHYLKGINDLEFDKDYLFYSDDNDDKIYIHDFDKINNLSDGDFEYFEKELNILDKYENFDIEILFELENKDLKQILTSCLNKKKEEYKKEEEVRKQRDLELKNEQEERLKEFEKLNKSENETIKFENITIHKNKMKFFDKELILKKNIKDVFTIEQISKINNYNYRNNGFIKNILVKLKEDFEIKGKYKLEFKTKGVKFNGVDIAVNKIDTIINNVINLDDKEEIGLINSLSLMKVELLNLKEMTTISIKNNQVNNLKIPLKITTNDTKGKSYNFEMLNKKGIISWDRAKEIFFSGGKSRTSYNRLEIEDLEKIYTQDLNGSREDFFKDLHKLSILKELEDGSN